MLSLLFLTTWMISGAALTAALAEPHERRGAWVPYGLILGPLWAAVAFDRRATRPPRDNGRVQWSSRNTAGPF